MTSLASALVALTLHLSPPMCACSCAGSGPLEGIFTRSAAVVRGRVADIAWDSTGNIATVRIAVERAWKWPGTGSRPPRELIVKTAQGTACGAYFGEGEEWLVFAQPAAAGRGLWTGQCTGTDPVEIPGNEPWQRLLRDEVRNRLTWLRQRVGDGSRPAA